ncbi:uncharacterized protein LOC130015280 [Mercurialis annua]|uniref:uncharacterized protein LOC130015280 n=1 Tax=Mercurialis annua TaxID=3986 RepID=UPI0024ACA14A|nr:uncharacterized protein LOC130015280 [Mercurialis annua]
MKLLSWNLQGLGNPWTVRALNFFIHNVSPSVFFLMETKLVKSEFSSICRSFSSYNFFIVDSSGRKGGLALFWKNNVDVTIGGSSSNHIEFEVSDMTTNRRWRGAGIYGWPEAANKHLTCDLIRQLGLQGSDPLLLRGDQREINGFREALVDGGLDDLGQWRDIYPDGRVSHLARYRSDHCPIVVDTSVIQVTKAPKPFRFEQMWMSHSQFEEVVKDAWIASLGMTTEFMGKLELCSNQMKSWAHEAFGSVRKQLKQKLDSIKTLQDGDSNVDSDRQIAVLAAEVDELLNREEIMWRQRSRADWLREGDRNTKFFHHKASSRKKNNSITRICDDFGNWQYGEDISRVAINYFNKIFTTSNPSNQNLVISCIHSAISDDQRDELQRSFCEEEIRSALKHMGPTKAPGPDGMHALFYSSYWQVIGRDVVRCILEFMRTGVMPANMNHTFITLIPKNDSPESMKDLRPISLCNVIYKLISKVLANRLKCVLSSVIDESQSAFVPGRLITDNAIVAFEMFHSMAKRSQGKNGSIALKLDMSKAYDRVEWKFIEAVMVKMQFPVHFIKLIMACVTSVSYSVLINGIPSGNICPQRGLRQGDPLSLYLFLLCAEGFSALLRQGVRNGDITGGSVCRGGPKINHLFFADDSVLFVKATVRECTAIKRIISVFEEASGQVVNGDKSELCFNAATPPSNRQAVQNILGYKVVTHFKKYLGMPTMVGRSKKHIFGFLRDRLHKRVLGWKENFLSKAGREVLIKSIAQSIPTYMMSCFALPVSFCNDMQSIISRFWWSGTDDKRKIPWVSWRFICQSKKDGGLGFRNLRAFNVAMLGKQAWKLIQEPNSLCATVLRAKYFSNTDFMQARLRPGSSFVWRSIIKGRRILDCGLAWRVGNGRSIDVKGDKWITSSNYMKPIGCLNVQDGSRVSDFIDENLAKWDVEKLQIAFSPNEVDCILQIPISQRLPPDKLFWVPNKNGNYSVKSGYYQARNIVERDRATSSGMSMMRDFWKQIWRCKVQPKIKHFLWRIGHDSLPCNANLVKRMQFMNELCPRCGLKEESALHALKDCDEVRGIWLSSPLCLRVDNIPSTTVVEWLRLMTRSLKTEDLQLFIMSLWTIWIDRNNIVFGNNRLPPHLLFSNIHSLIPGADKDSREALLDEVSAVQTWQPPPTSAIKVNTDAAVSTERKRSVAGAVCRDSSGRVIKGGVCVLNGVVDSELAEALAVQFGMKLASEVECSELLVESDSLGVIQRLHNPLNAIDHIQLIIEDCLAIPLNSSVRFQHVRRHCNHIAHTIAKWGMFIGRDYSFDGDLPYPINELFVNPV